MYRYIYVHIARTHERLALQWHTIYSEEKWAKYFKNEKRSKKGEFLIVNIENGGKREFWWSARRMKVVWKGRMAIQVTKGHTQRAFINSTIVNDNDTVNIYIYVGTLAMKIQRHICFNTIVTQRLLLLRASKFSILPSLVSSSFSLFLFFFFFFAFQSYGRLLSSEDKTLSIMYVSFEEVNLSAAFGWLLVRLWKRIFCATGG